MKSKELLQRIITSLMCLLLVVSCIPATVFARTNINTAQKTSLNIQYLYEGTAVSNANFSLYKVADMSADAVFTLTSDFSGYAVELNKLDSTGWREMAETLSAYASRDKIQPVKSGKTDAAGQLIFSDLQVGLYLMIGDDIQQNGYTYSTPAQLLTLPNLNASEAWEYDVVLIPKMERIPIPVEPTTSRKVIKVWNDDGYKKKRPEEVTIELLQDGDVYDTVTLSSDNNWRHTWKELPEGHKYQVVEQDVPDEYKVKITRDGKTFTVKNTYKKPAASTPKPGPKLPQTGMLWWPVPLLAAAGFMMFILGWVLKRRPGANHE